MPIKAMLMCINGAVESRYALGMLGRMIEYEPGDIWDS